MKNQQPIILDVDTGVDDALAILFAIRSRRLHIVGITTGFGNVDVTQATENTRRVVALADPDDEIPIAMGAEKPLFRPRRKGSLGIHGENGLGGYELPKTDWPVISESAADFLIKQIHLYPNQLTLVFTGRLTNLAIALAKDPTIVHKVKRLIVMGGALNVPGNVTPVSEANIHGDPEAAHRVFESGMPLTMVGLDVTGRTKFGDSHLTQLMNALGSEQTVLKDFLYQVFTFSFQASENFREGRFRLMHDPLAVAVAEEPSLVTMQDHYIYIETKGSLSQGATLADLRRPQKNTNASVCIDVQDERFLQHYIQTIAAHS